MKNLLKTLFVLLVVLLTTHTLYSKEYGELLNESFEKGIPQDWIQENLSGDINWTVESADLTHPSNAFDGACRLAFRNTSKVTKNAKTRLVLPVIDISNLYQPILVFAHAQDRWASDFDTLKVFYRTSTENPWIELEVFDKPLNRWQLDTLRLNSGTKTYQLAFEATDNLGYGIVIDKVTIRSTPNCMDPYNVVFKEISNNSALLSWLGAFDAESFSVRLSTVKYDTEQIDEIDQSQFAFSEEVSAVWSFQLNSLNPATKYYCYIKSNCYDESSAWVVDSFTTANIKGLPYCENFNVEPTSGYVSRLDTWYSFSNMDECRPFVNSYIPENRQHHYSSDASFVLSFGQVNISGLDVRPIPAGTWAYITTPLLDIEDMSKVRMSWKTIHYNQPVALSPEHFAIVVGVMTNPADKQTFVPVDTVEVTNICDYYECFVSLENYSGDGKFIAFMSDFEGSNLFFIDDLDIHIEKALEVPNFQVSITKASSLQLNFSNNYSQYEVVVSESSLTTAQLNVADVIQVVNNQEIAVQPNKEYFVYARAINGEEKGDWSYYKRARSIGKIDVYPMTYDFNITESPTSSYVPSVGIYQAPIVTTSSSGGGSGTIGSGTIGSGDLGVGAMQDRTYMDNRLNILTTAYEHFPNCLMTSMEQELHMRAINHSRGSMVTIFPEMITPIRTDVRFNVRKALSESYRFYVGLMSDANNINSFVAIDTITSDEAKSFYLYSLGKYNVEGNFFAIKIDRDGFEGGVNEFLVENVVFSESPLCPIVQNTKWASVEDDPSRVVLTWDADGVTQWNVRLSQKSYDIDSLDVPGNVFLYDTTVVTNRIEFTGLEYPKKEYFFWVQPICSDGLPGKWGFTESFVTQCRQREPIPYIEDFENPSYLASATEAEFTVQCMDAIPLKYSTNYYPSVIAYTSKVVQFNKGKDQLDEHVFLTLPRMAEPLNKLQLSFNFSCVSTMGRSVAIGVMKTPFDIENVEIVAEIKHPVLQEFAEFIVPFDNYTGDGEYIVIMNGSDYVSGVMYIDDIRVDYINSCRRPENVVLKDVSTDWAIVGWVLPETQKSAKVVVTSEKVAIDALDEAILSDSNVIVSVQSHEGDTIKFTGLTPNTKYYVYVKNLCSAEETSSWSNYLLFRTNCVELDSYQMGVETFETYEEKYPPCYTVGNKTDQTATSYIPTITSSKGVDASKALKINSSVTANGAYAIMPAINVDRISRLRMKMFAAAKIGTSYAQKLVVGVVTEVDQLSSFVPVDTLELDAAVRPYDVYFNKYEGDDYGYQGRRVMFLSEFDGSNEVYIDNISFDTIPDCFAVFNVTNITDTSATLNFLSDATKYEVKCASKPYEVTELDADTVLPSVIINGKSGDVTGLEYNTTYYLYVRAICGENSYSEWTSYQTIKTDCYQLIRLPFSEDFEAEGLDCWNTFYSATSTAYPKIATTPVHSGGKSVQLRNTSTLTSYIATAAVDVDRLSKCKVKFYACPSVAKKAIVLTIGVVSDINDISGTFVDVETVSLNKTTANVWEEYEVSLKTYAGTAKHVAFKINYISTTTYVYLDDISLEIEKACYEPEEFEFVSRTDNSLTLSFVHYGAMSYDVNYGPKGFNNEIEGSTLSVQDTIFTIANLAADTEYDVYVRANCNAKDKSEWVYVGAYSTLVQPLSEYPAAITFDDATENASWRFAQQSQQNQWFIGADDDKVVSDQKSNSSSLGSMKPADNGLYISCDNGATANYKADVVSKSWAYRTIYLTPGVYKISYDWTCYGETNKDYFRVLLTTPNYQFVGGDATLKDYNGVLAGTISTVTAQQPSDCIDLSHKVSASEAYNSSIDTTQILSAQWIKEENIVVVTPDMEGAYNLVFYWKNDDKTEAQQYSVRGAVVDNIAIIKESCPQPYQLTAKYLSYDKGYASWEPIVEQQSEYVVLVTTEEVADPLQVTSTQVAFADTVNTTSVTITGLAGSTTYYVYVKSYCSADNSSLWVGPVVFETLCPPVALGTMFSFDNEGDVYLPSYEGTGTNTLYNKPSGCFVVGNAGLEFTSANAQYTPYIIKNTTSIYSRSGDYALRLYATTTKGSGGYVVLPLVDDEDSDSLLLSFWMRPFYEQSTGKLYVTYNGTTYARKITVGTMTDPNDPSTYRKLKDFEYPVEAGSIPNTTLATSDPNGEEYWVQCLLPLSNVKGKYLVLKNDNYGKTNCVYVDDIQVSKVVCVPPTTLKAANLKSTSVSITASSACDAQQYILQLSTDMNFETEVIEKISERFPAFEIDSLLPATKYYARMQSLCSAVESSGFSTILEFTTSNGLSYDEDFSVASYCPTDWKRSTTTTLSSYCPTLDLTAVNNRVNITGGWNSCEPLFERGMFSTRHISVVTENIDEKITLTRWLVSPEIDLSGAENYQLTFDIALTDLGTNEPISLDDYADTDDKFVVAVNEIGTKQWSYDSLTTWKGDKLHAIPNTGEHVRLDLSKFAGKVVQIAFYVYSNHKNSSMEVHLDDVHVNAYDVELTTVTLCQMEDYYDEHFDIKYEDIEVGSNLFSRVYEYKSKHDVRVDLNVNMTPSVETVIDESICEGDVYAKYNFPSLTNAGVYKQKLTAANGCDSVVVLNLSVIPVEEFMVVDTICYGGSVVWNGVERNKTGVYSDTLVSKLTGCDSITTLVLYVKEAIRVEVSKNICFGETYQFGTQTITESGTYIEQFVTEQGCDSIVTLNANVLPDLRTTINATIKDGERYYDDNFEGLSVAGTYTNELVSVDGCDSTITLILEVETGIAINNVNMIDLVLVPNPVKAEDVFLVQTDFTTEEMSGLVVEMFDAIGQCVYTSEPTIYPIAIEALSVRGVYLVRITSGSGNIYQSKIVVK